MVTMGAFQAARSAVGRSFFVGMNQRMVEVAPMRESARGATNLCSQDFPGRPSESANTRISNSGGNCSIAVRRLFTFSLHAWGAPAITMWAGTREEATTRFKMLWAGSFSDETIKKTS